MQLHVVGEGGRHLVIQRHDHQAVRMEAEEGQGRFEAGMKRGRGGAGRAGTRREGPGVGTVSRSVGRSGGREGPTSETHHISLTGLPLTSA